MCGLLRVRLRDLDRQEVRTCNVHQTFSQRLDSRQSTVHSNQVQDTSRTMPAWSIRIAPERFRGAEGDGHDGVRFNGVWNGSPHRSQVWKRSARHCLSAKTFSHLQRQNLLRDPGPTLDEWNVDHTKEMLHVVRTPLPGDRKKAHELAAHGVALDALQEAEVSTSAPACLSELFSRSSV